MPETWAITGASRGIGLALCQAHLARGESVVATYRGDLPEALNNLHASHGSRLRCLQWDLRVPLAPNKVARVLDGPIDVVIANAGTFGPRQGSFRGADYNGLIKAFDINALGFLRTVEAFLPQMTGAPRPRIAAISSLLGTVGKAGPGNIGYRMSKAAENIAVHSVAAELAGEKIAMACLRPGWVRTNMGGPDGQISPEESAAQLLAVVDAMTFTSKPRFLDLDGSTLPW